MPLPPAPGVILLELSGCLDIILLLFYIEVVFTIVQLVRKGKSQDKHTHPVSIKSDPLIVEFTLVILFYFMSKILDLVRLMCCQQIGA